MATETIEQTPAEQRKATAAELVKKLETEAAQLRKRKQTTEAAIERLHQEIVTAERAGANAKTLTALRQQRAEQQQVLGDLPRMLPSIDREIELARGELGAATIACHADRYNQIAEKQRALKEVMLEAIDTFLEALKVKEGLAQQQYKIQMDDNGWLHPGISPEGVRRAFLQEITKRLEDTNYKPNVFSMERIDWSCRRMRADGDLLPIA